MKRIVNKMTQKQVASEIGITTQSYQAYEAGETLPNVVHLLKLCMLYNIGLDELFELKTKS